MSTKSSSDLNEICRVNRGWLVMHDSMPYHPTYVKIMTPLKFDVFLQFRSPPPSIGIGTKSTLRGWGKAQRTETRRPKWLSQGFRVLGEGAYHPCLPARGFAWAL